MSSSHILHVCILNDVCVQGHQGDPQDLDWLLVTGRPEHRFPRRREAAGCWPPVKIDPHRSAGIGGADQTIGSLVAAKLQAAGRLLRLILTCAGIGGVEKKMMCAVLQGV